VLRALVLIAVSGCAALIGIDDERRLACQQLDVITDRGATVSLSPPFASDQPTYRGAVGNDVATVQIEMTCNDAAATIVANDLPVIGGQSPRFDLRNPLVIDIAVVAATADPASQLMYHITVDRPSSLEPR
jgi:hypothetical protein